MAFSSSRFGRPSRTPFAFELCNDCEHSGDQLTGGGSRVDFRFGERNYVRLASIDRRYEIEQMLQVSAESVNLRDDNDVAWS